MNIVIFNFTNKYLDKKFSKDTLNKYRDVLGFLYQNGYELNCSDKEVEEQLEMYNFFKSEDDFKLLNDSYKVASSDIGNKIVEEELYDIVKGTSFCRNEITSEKLYKVYADINWENIIYYVDRLNELINSKDIEIAGTLTDNRVAPLREKLDEIDELIFNEDKTNAWKKFVEIIDYVYNLYISMTKTKADQHNISKLSNLNDEIYGSVGGYNPLNNEIKCIYGSAIYNVKTILSTNDIGKIRVMANLILSEDGKDDDGIKYLIKWCKGTEKDNEKARQVVVNCLLNGILTLLQMKHNFSFLEQDIKNQDRMDRIKKEFTSILNYLNIDKGYLL